MSIHLPTLKQLQYLVALRTHGHFGRAAEACFVTQSTLSAGIKELETLIGVTLVERTPAGGAVHAARPRSPTRRSGSCARPKTWPTWSAPRASRSPANCGWA